MTSEYSWTLRALAERVLEDKDAPPVAVLAAWRCFYQDDNEELGELFRLALADAGVEVLHAGKPGVEA